MSTRALLVIDAQNEYDAEGRLPISFPPFADSVQAIGASMDAAAQAGAYVVVVQHDFPVGSPVFALGSHGWELHPEVATRSRDLLVNKSYPGAFTGTGLAAWLTEREVTTLTVVGYMTQHCIDSTARQAMHAGFTVEVLHDATGTLDYVNSVGQVTAEQMHHAQLAALQAGFAAVGSLAQWQDALAQQRSLTLGNPLSSSHHVLASST